MTYLVVRSSGALVGKATESWETASDRCARELDRNKLCRVVIKEANGFTHPTSKEQNDEIIAKYAALRAAK